jgi:hypothetical protein
VSDVTSTISSGAGAVESGASDVGSGVESGVSAVGSGLQTGGQYVASGVETAASDGWQYGVEAGTYAVDHPGTVAMVGGTILLGGACEIATEGACTPLLEVAAEEEFGAGACDVAAVASEEGLGGVAGAESAGTSAVNPLGGTENCVACAIAGDATLSGNRAVATNVGPRGIGVIEDELGSSFRSVAGRNEIENILADAGSGSRGVVFGSRGVGEVGHVWNAVNQGGAIRFIDFQSGTEASWEGYRGFQFLLSGGG